MWTRRRHRRSTARESTPHSLTWTAGRVAASTFFACALVCAPLGGFASSSPADPSGETAVTEARLAARQDRNADAARLFSLAVAELPASRTALLPELCDQLTYSGKSAVAIPLYHEVLASPNLDRGARRHAELGLALALSYDGRLGASLATYDALVARDPGDLEARLGRARVLSWENAYHQSLLEYDRVLARDPKNFEARENIARVQQWRGRQRDARREARAVLAERANDVSAALTLAHAEIALGRSDVATRSERALIATHPTDAGTRDLAATLRDAATPQLRISATTGRQSDGVSLRSNVFEAEATGDAGLESIGIRDESIGYLGDHPFDVAAEHRVGVFARRRFSDWAELHATLADDEISATSATTRDRTLYNSYLTLQPNDALRFDFGAARETYDNRESLRLGITSEIEGASMDFTPDENSRISLRANRSRISDGIVRGWTQLETERVLTRSPQLSVGARVTDYSFSAQTQSGYFSPPRYQSAEATSHFFGNFRNRLYYDASGSYGREWVFDGGTRPTHAVHGSLTELLSRATDLTFSYDSFDTRQSTSGFARTTFGVQLKARW